jgi:hypothetical protein
MSYSHSGMNAWTTWPPCRKIMKRINNVETLSLSGCDLGIDPSF